MGGHATAVESLVDAASQTEEKLIAHPVIRQEMIVMIDRGWSPLDQLTPCRWRAARGKKLF